MASRKMMLTVAVAAVCAMPVSRAFADGEKIVAAFHNLAEPFFVFMQRELTDEAKKQNVSVSVLDGQASSPKQTSDVENALVQGVDGIVLAPTDVKALAPAVNEVIEEEIPLVTVDRRVEGADKPVAHVGADNVAGGRKMAEWVVKNYPNGARIVLLTGQPGSSSGIDRAKGVHDAIAKAGDKYKIVAEQTANWERAQGLTVSENILTSLSGNPPDVILALNDDMALGAIEAIHSTGLSGKGIKVLGFDAVPEALKQIKAGQMAATVEQSPSVQIRTALKALVDNIRNQTELKSTAIEPVLITAENIQKAERIAEVKD
jgi:inositol transport system substrate-binding protein